MRLNTITPPSAEPMTIEELKSSVSFRVDHNDDDDALLEELKTARELFELRLGMRFMTQVVELSLDAFPSAEIVIPIHPVQSIESIVYDDAAGLETTVDSDSYYLDNRDASGAAWVIPIDGWPTDALSAANAVRVRAVAGYTTSGLVPSPIKAAIRLKVQEAYDGIDNSRSIRDLLINFYKLVA